MKLELGGGVFPRGDGWVNVDIKDVADVVCDLNAFPWPFEDDSAESFYCCHALEHLADPHAVLREIARVGVLGAPVEIRTPHPNSHLAMVAGHLHVFSPMEALNMDKYFPNLCWFGPKRLKLQSWEYASSELLEQARKELPFLAGLDDQLVMKWIQGTAHETRFYYTVEANELYERQP